MKSKFYKNKLFSVGIIIFLMMFISACTTGSGERQVTADSFSISGKVTVDGTGIAGVTVTLLADGETPAEVVTTGAKKISRSAAALTPQTTTDASGNYTFSGLGNGTYTVVPQSGSYTFDDVSTVTNINGANVSNVDFVGTNCDTTYSISGTIIFAGLVAPASEGITQAGVLANPSGSSVPPIAGLPGVTIQLRMASLENNQAGTKGKSGSFLVDGSIIGTAITDGTGYYSFTGVAPGDYTVTAVNANYQFSPSSSQSVSIVSDNAYDYNWATKAVAFTQADLVGTWYMNLLRTGTVNEWSRAQISVDAGGVASCVPMSMSNSTNSDGCPDPFDLKLTIDATGVVTQSGANAADGSTGHMTMTSNKNFMAGTGTTGTSGSFQSKNSGTVTSPSDIVAGSYHLAIMQKVVPGTAYGNVDLRNKSFAFHGMSVGSANGWAYGTATSDAASVISITDSHVSPDDSVVSLPDGLTMSVNSSGIVTVGGVTSFQGFLSDDRKTIVGTFSSDDSYQLVIIQVLGQTYPEGTLLGQMAAGHSLATGHYGPFWAHYKVVSAKVGKIYFYDWETSDLSPAPTSGFFNASISSTGTVTIAEDTSYNGQISHDGLFQVSTQTLSSEPALQNQPNYVDTNFYMLSVATKPGMQKLPKNQ
jgi:hypothetical protein